MHNVEFTDLTQITNNYTQDLFQSIFLTIMQPQIIQERLKTQPRIDYLIFLRF